MEKIKLRVTANVAEVVESPEIITSGTIGLPVEITFDSRWEGLTKLAVFRGGDTTIAVTYPEGGTVVPWEVLEKPNVWLQIGVYGVNADGSVAIPTMWATVRVIHTGADPNGADAPATRGAWQEMLDEVNNLKNNLASKQELENHLSDEGNPHGVTCEQIGAVDEETLQPRVEDILIQDINNGGNISNSGLISMIESLSANTLVQEGLTGHADDTDNPHQVTAKQIGAVTTQELNERLSNLGGGSSAEVTEHINDTDNPHNVTCAKIGAVPVEEIGLYVNDIVVSDINGDGDISNAIGPLIGTEVQSTLEQQNLLTHAFDNENPHNVTASQIGAVTTAELANTKTIFNNKAIDTAYAYREGIYSDFLTSVHYPDESFLMEKYLGGTFKVVWTAVHYTSYTTSEAMEVCIPVPFKVKSHNITIGNYSDYCHTLEVIPGNTSGVDGADGIYAFWVSICADAPEEGAESNLLDFTITITGTWE